MFLGSDGFMERSFVEEVVHEEYLRFLSVSDFIQEQKADFRVQSVLSHLTVFANREYNFYIDFDQSKLHLKRVPLGRYIYAYHLFFEFESRFDQSVCTVAGDVLTKQNIPNAGKEFISSDANCVNPFLRPHTYDGVFGIMQRMLSYYFGPSYFSYFSYDHFRYSDSSRWNPFYSDVSMLDVVSSNRLIARLDLCYDPMITLYRDNTVLHPIMIERYLQQKKDAQNIDLFDVLPLVENEDKVQELKKLIKIR